MLSFLAYFISTTFNIRVAPTRFGKFQLILTYGIQTKGIDAEAIRNADNNTVGDDLINAITSIVLGLLGQSVAARAFTPREFNRAKFPRISPFDKKDVLSIYLDNRRHHSDDMERRGLEVVQSLSPYERWRKLATYHETDPVYHKAMFDDGKIGVI